jgi:hypothetical protein
MRCFSSSVVPLQPPQPCMSFMRYGVVKSTAPSNHHKHSQSHKRWPRKHIWRCHCASRSSLPRVFHISNQYLTCHHLLLHIILSALRDAISKNTYFSLQKERHICGRRLSSRHHATQATKPPYPLLNSTGRYHAMPITTFPSAMRRTFTRLVLKLESIVARLPHCRERLAPLSLSSPDRRPGFRVEDSTRACLLKEYLMSHESLEIRVCR